MTTERIENFVNKLKTKKSKNVIYLICALAVIGCFSYRFYTVYKENSRDVFNIVRNNIENGTPVETLKMSETDGVLYEPLNIKHNRAYVSGARVNKFKSSQKIGDCKIVSVSKNIDLYTGMHIIKTSLCKDGLQYVEYNKRGFYVPVSAVYGNSVYVVNGDKAQMRDIVIQARDSQNVLVKSGLKNGDIVILSKVKDNEKIKIMK
jgi:hypothetical protein